MSRRENHRYIDPLSEILHGGTDSPSKKNPFLFANEKDFSIKLKFKKVLDNDSGEVIRILRYANHDH
jgi:hypothetical protein